MVAKIPERNSLTEERCIWTCGSRGFQSTRPGTRTVWQTRKRRHSREAGRQNLERLMPCNPLPSGQIPLSWGKSQSGFRWGNDFLNLHLSVSGGGVRTGKEVAKEEKRGKEKLLIFACVWCIHVYLQVWDSRGRVVGPKSMSQCKVSFFIAPFFKLLKQGLSLKLALRLGGPWPVITSPYGQRWVYTDVPPCLAFHVGAEMTPVLICTPPNFHNPDLFFLS